MLLLCRRCWDIRALGRAARTCRCGTVMAWLLPSQVAGAPPVLARFWTPSPEDRAAARVVEVSNHFLQAATSISQAEQNWPAEQIDALHRQAHGQATVAPLYLFDRSRRACPWAICEPGTTRYSGWASEAEARAAGPRLAPAEEVLR